MMVDKKNSCYIDTNIAQLLSLCNQWFEETNVIYSLLYNVIRNLNNIFKHIQLLQILITFNIILCLLIGLKVKSIELCLFAILMPVISITFIFSNHFIHDIITVYKSVKIIMFNICMMSVKHELQDKNLNAMNCFESETDIKSVFDASELSQFKDHSICFDNSQKSTLPFVTFFNLWKFCIRQDGILYALITWILSEGLELHEKVNLKTFIITLFLVTVLILWQKNKNLITVSSEIVKYSNMLKNKTQSFLVQSESSEIMQILCKDSVSFYSIDALLFFMFMTNSPEKREAFKNLVKLLISNNNKRVLLPISYLELQNECMKSNIVSSVETYGDTSAEVTVHKRDDYPSSESSIINVDIPVCSRKKNIIKNRKYLKQHHCIQRKPKKTNTSTKQKNAVLSKIKSGHYKFNTRKRMGDSKDGNTTDECKKANFLNKEFNSKVANYSNAKNSSVFSNNSNDREKQPYFSPNSDLEMNHSDLESFVDSSEDQNFKFRAESVSTSDSDELGTNKNSQIKKRLFTHSFNSDIASPNSHFHGEFKYGNLELSFNHSGQENSKLKFYQESGDELSESEPVFVMDENCNRETLFTRLYEHSKNNEIYENISSCEYSGDIPSVGAVPKEELEPNEMQSKQNSSSSEHGCTSPKKEFTLEEHESLMMQKNYLTCKSIDPIKFDIDNINLICIPKPSSDTISFDYQNQNIAQYLQLKCNKKRLKLKIKKYHA